MGHVDDVDKCYTESSLILQYSANCDGDVDGGSRGDVVEYYILMEEENDMYLILVVISNGPERVMILSRERVSEMKTVCQDFICSWIWVGFRFMVCEDLEVFNCRLELSRRGSGDSIPRGEERDEMSPSLRDHIDFLYVRF